MMCSNCGSEDITDYNEFGCPGGYRYFCNECHFLWGKLQPVDQDDEETEGE